MNIRSGFGTLLRCGLLSLFCVSSSVFIRPKCVPRWRLIFGRLHPHSAPDEDCGRGLKTQRVSTVSAGRGLFRPDYLLVASVSPSSTLTHFRFILNSSKQKSTSKLVHRLIRRMWMGFFFFFFFFFFFLNFYWSISNLFNHLMDQYHKWF